MMDKLTEEEINIICKGLDLWAKDGHEAVYFAEITGLLIAGDDKEMQNKVNHDVNKMKKDHEQRKKLRRVAAVKLQAKLYSMFEMGNLDFELNKN